MSVQKGHVRSYSAETITIRSSKGASPGKNNMRTVNFFFSLLFFIPILIVFGSVGGNPMLAFFLILTVVPLGYIFFKFF